MSPLRRLDFNVGCIGRVRVALLPLMEQMKLERGLSVDDVITLTSSTLPQKMEEKGVKHNECNNDVKQSLSAGQGLVYTLRSNTSSVKLFDLQRKQ